MLSGLGSGRTRTAMLSMTASAGRITFMWSFLAWRSHFLVTDKRLATVRLPRLGGTCDCRLKVFCSLVRSCRGMSRGRFIGRMHMVRYCRVWMLAGFMFLPAGILVSRLRGTLIVGHTRIARVFHMEILLDPLIKHIFFPRFGTGGAGSLCLRVLRVGRGFPLLFVVHLTKNLK